MRISVAHGAAALVSLIRRVAGMAEQKKSSGRANSLLTFAPWIVYGFASGFKHWRVASGGGLILCIVSLALAARGGRSIKLMDWTTLTFFAIASVLTSGIRSTTFPVYNAVVVWSCFAIAAWSSVIVGRPFTEVYARENAPPEFWNNPVFVRLNLIMTLVWCSLMTVNIGFAAIGVIIGGKLAPPLFGFAMPTALLICGFIFNSHFPGPYLARSGFQMDAASVPAPNA